MTSLAEEGGGVLMFCHALAVRPLAKRGLIAVKSQALLPGLIIIARACMDILLASFGGEETGIHDIKSSGTLFRKSTCVGPAGGRLRVTGLLGLGPMKHASPRA